MFVGISNGTADEITFTEDFVGVDFSAEFVGITAAVERTAADAVAAEVVINLPDAVGKFVIVKLMLGIEEKVCYLAAGKG